MSELTISQVAKLHNITTITMRNYLGSYKLSKYLIARNTVNYTNECIIDITKYVKQKIDKRKNYTFKLSEDEFSKLNNLLLKIRD